MNQQLTISFYNTINLTGPDLTAAREACNKQEQRILDLMAVGQLYTPFEVRGLYNRIYPACPITSIRRAMTNLTDKGYLIKSDKMKAGEFGKNNYCWIKK